jgi:hypothetical protein
MPREVDVLSRPALSAEVYPMNSLRSIAVAASLACFLLAGCHITGDKNGKNDNVDISTPFGSMKVKTNDKADTTSIGLTAYPGAVPVKDDDGDKNSADVDLSFGDFHLGVKAAGFQTNDSTDKVMAFYRKDMARYGDVIECQHDKPVGTPTRTAQGLSCSDNHGHGQLHGNVSTNSQDEIQLRAGSEMRQHIVGIETKNGGTHIGLVMLNLPSQIKSHDDKETE